MIKVISIVVTYNAMQWIDRCLSSLLHSGKEADVFVYDNCSTDGTREYIKAQYPEVILKGGDKNLGFAKSNNIGIRYALDNGYDYVFLLNQDAWVEENTLEELVRTFEDNENVGIASPVHLTGDGNSLDFYFASKVPLSYVQDLYSGNVQKYYCVSESGAAAWMLSRKCIETVGGFDTDLFVHYGEDDNYCQRVLYHGFRIIFNTRCNMFHDRQNRGDDSNYSGRQIWNKQNWLLYEKSQWANIQNGIKLNSITVASIFRITINLLKLDIKNAKVQRERLRVLRIVRKSRQISKTRGAHWL